MIIKLIEILIIQNKKLTVLTISTTIQELHTTMKILGNIQTMMLLFTLTKDITIGVTGILIMDIMIIGVTDGDLDMVIMVIMYIVLFMMVTTKITGLIVFITILLIIIRHIDIIRIETTETILMENETTPIAHTEEALLQVGEEVQADEEITIAA